jgi:hypothetical protein
MTTPLSPAAQGLVADLRRIFGTRLRSVVAYGPHAEGAADAPLTCLALVTSLTAGDLEACARAAKDWRRAGAGTPLVLPEAEFHDSLDAFPLEYGEIIRAHVVLYGDVDPFAGVTIARADLRRACETQVKSHLVHLREGFIETGAGPTDVARLVHASAPSFAALLRNVARLAGVHSSDRMDTALQGARAAGLGDGVIADVLALERPAAVPTADAARLFPEYLDAVERLAHAVDTWPE